MIEHNTDSLDCWCRPTPKGNSVYLHKTWGEFLEYVAQLEDAYGKVAHLEADRANVMNTLSAALHVLAHITCGECDNDLTECTCSDGFLALMEASDE